MRMFSRRWSCAWAGVVNLENRLVPGGIDSRVLAELRKAADEGLYSPIPPP
jgi:hypothetical protein